ncbi:hypothetical protein ABIA33_004681 [Streptacidiphilus sp. MAP12-16]|uniref:hypothetical protein n=1 Tax=Streptacidiphilus sp. MAP12-16 TaxID=3156300 RepID=UPI0035123273
MAVLAVQPGLVGVGAAVMRVARRVFFTVVGWCFGALGAVTGVVGLMTAGEWVLRLLVFEEVVVDVAQSFVEEGARVGSVQEYVVDFGLAEQDDGLGVGCSAYDAAGSVVVAALGDEQADGLGAWVEFSEEFAHLCAGHRVGEPADFAEDVQAVVEGGEVVVLALDAGFLGVPSVQGQGVTPQDLELLAACLGGAAPVLEVLVSLAR